MPLDRDNNLLAAGDVVLHDGRRCIITAVGSGNVGPNVVLEREDDKRTFAIHSGETIKEPGVSPTNVPANSHVSP